MYYNNKRLILSIFWIVLGAALIVFSMTEVLDSSLYAGMGGALMAVGVLQAVRNVRYRKDPEYREKIDTERNDERNRFLAMKSWSWAGYLVVMIEGVGGVIAMILGKRDLQLIFSYQVCLIIFLYWLCYLFLKRKY